jgi:hypothetical protein
MKPSVLGLFIAAGAFGASTIYLAVQLKEERAQADAIAEQTRLLNGRIAELERVRAELEALSPGGQSPRTESMAQAGPAGTAAPVGPEVQTIETRQGPEAGERFTPPPRTEAMQKMLRAQMRANFKRMNSDIGEKLGLSREDANKLIDLMIDQQMDMVDRSRQARAGDLTPEQRAAQYVAQQEKNTAEIAALIGADKLDAYKAYQESMPARQEVDMLSRQLEANDLGLSKDQRDRMVTALAEERRRVPAPSYSDGVSREEYNQEMSAWTEDYNQRAATRASSILTSDQQETYNQYQQWTKEMRQQFEARRAAREAGGAGGPPPR